MTVNASVSDGAVSFVVGSIVDMAGNAGSGTSSVTDGSSVMVDQSSLTLTARELRSNNSASTTRAVVGDLVTLAIAASKTILTPTVAFSVVGGAAVSTSRVTVLGSGAVYSASFIVDGSDADGVIAFNVSYTDVGGNAGVPSSSSSDGHAVLIDNTAPTLTGVSLSSSPVPAGPGGTITLAFNSSEALGSDLAVSIEGHTVTATCDALLSCVASHTVDASIDSGGSVGFTIVYDDVAGNDGTAVSSTTDGSSASIDLTAPTLTTVSMVSDNAGDATLANAGDTVTVTIVASEAIEAPIVTIAGVSVESSAVVGSGNSWTATHTVVSGDLEGVAALSVAYVDVVGNGGVGVTAVTDTSSVTIDLTAPTLVSVGLESNADDPSVAVDGSVVSVHFNVSEAI